MKSEDMFKVDGYGVVVTGGSSGLGLAFAEVLAENGARVTLLGRSPDHVTKQTDRLQKAGLDVRGKVVDVTDRPALIGAIDEAAALYGRLDVLFANAGTDAGPGYIGFDGKTPVPESAIDNYADDRWDKLIDTNLNSVFTSMKAAARHMKPRRSGRIIVTTSVAADIVEPAIGVAYMVSKAGAAHLVRNIALELAAYNILVNSIAPGPFITNIGGGHAYEPAVQAAFGSRVPLKRMASTEEIKGLALLLASPASSFITGAEMLIDGGYHLGTIN